MTGRSVCEPVRLRARSYEVEVRPGKDLDGHDQVGPTVETFHLQEEGEYLVLDTGRRANSS
jgi:hypothetical protein